MSKELFWKTLDSKSILNTSWLKVEQESCLLPNGKVISDFYTLWQPDWVLILPKTSQGKWLLTSQYRHGSQQMSLEFPAGIINAGETPLEAAKRELEEETQFRGGTFTFLGEFFMNPDRHRGRFFAYVAEGVIPGGNAIPDETENIFSLEIAEQELNEKICSGEMNHPHQMAAFLKYKFLKEQSQMLNL